MFLENCMKIIQAVAEKPIIFSFEKSFLFIKKNILLWLNLWRIKNHRVTLEDYKFGFKI